MPPEAIDCLPDVPEAPVSYWIPSSDYYRLFDRTVLLWFFNNSQKASFEGTFGNRDCGGKMSGLTTWLNCPQLMLRFVQPSQVIIEFKLLDRRIREQLTFQGTAMQLHLLKGKPTNDPLTPQEGIQPTQIMGASVLADLLDDEEAHFHPSVTIRLDIPSGNYIAIPSLGPLSQSLSPEQYILKVYSIAAFDIRLVN
jgi:hypothetical protein